MRIANPARQMRGNPHFFNAIMAMGLVVGPVCVYYLVAKQPDNEKEHASVSTRAPWLVVAASIALRELAAAGGDALQSTARMA